MEEGDVKPGTFLEFTSRTIDDPALVYVVRDEPKERSWLIVDLYSHGTIQDRPSGGIRYMAYYAITRDVEEFEGNIDEAKRETMRNIFP